MVMGLNGTVGKPFMMKMKVFVLVIELYVLWATWDLFQTGI